MGKSASGVLRAVALTLAVGLAAAAIYLNLTASTFLTSLAPAFPTPLILMAGLAIALFWLAYSRSLPTNAAHGREVEGLSAKPRAPLNPWIGALAIGIGVPAWLYFRHITRSHDQALWIDAYWPVLLPATVALMAIVWGWDTFLGRIVTGTATGKSPAGQRLKLVAERIAGVVLAAAAIIMSQSAFGWHLGGQPVYQTPAAETMMAAIAAMLVSFVFIQRQQAFDTRHSGSRRYG